MKKKLFSLIVMAVVAFGGVLYLYPNIAATALSGYIFTGTIRPGSAINAYGIVAQPTFAGTSSETRDELAGLYAMLTTTTVNAASGAAIMIPTWAAVGTDTGNAAGLQVAAPTAGLRNDAINVASGTVRVVDLKSTTNGTHFFVCVNTAGVLFSRSTACN